MEQIKSFLEKAQTNEALQANLKELAGRKAGVEEVVALAKDNGFAFSKEDFEAFVQKSLPSQELSAEQLAAVSGGTNAAVWIISSITIFLCGAVAIASVLSDSHEPICV